MSPKSHDCRQPPGGGLLCRRLGCAVGRERAPIAGQQINCVPRGARQCRPGSGRMGSWSRPSRRWPPGRRGRSIPMPSQESGRTGHVHARLPRAHGRVAEPARPSGGCGRWRRGRSGSGQSACGAAARLLARGRPHPRPAARLSDLFGRAGAGPRGPAHVRTRRGQHQALAGRGACRHAHRRADPFLGRGRHGRGDPGREPGRAARGRRHPAEGRGETRTRRSRPRTSGPGRRRTARCRKAAAWR